VEGTQQRANALASLRNIRYVLARRDFAPWIPPAHTLDVGAVDSGDQAFIRRPPT
jgi:hypothetical protein